MKRAIWMMAGLALMLGSVRQARADMVLYDNGAINGTIGGWGMQPPYLTSDSFTLSGASVLTGVQQIGLWVSTNNAPNTLVWEIGTTAFSSNVGSGTATLSNTPDGTAPYGYLLYDSSFSLPNVALGAGTYYLTLENATATNGGYVFWDENNGPSSAQGSTNGSPYSIGSESFQIEGYADPSAVPEPSSLTLLGIGTAAFAGYFGWRRRKQFVTA